MKESAEQIGQLVIAGELVTVGTYLNGRVEPVPIRDKTTGKMRTGYVSRETIITGRDAVVVGGFLNDDQDHKEWKPSAKPSQRVIVHVKGVDLIQGFQLYSGTIESLEK